MSAFVQLFEWWPTASHTEQQYFKYAWTTCNIVNTWPRNSHEWVSELRKNVILPYSGQKNYTCLFLLAFFNLGWRNCYCWSWTAWQWVNNPATAAKLDLNWETNKMHLHDITHGNTRVDIICLTNGDTKHLYPAYSGSIWCKPLRLRPLHALRCRSLNWTHLS